MITSNKNKKNISTMDIENYEKTIAEFISRAGNPPAFLRSKKKKEKQREKRKTFKEETIKRLSPRSKCYCFRHSRASRIQKIFLVGQPWWPTILVSVPWPLHFEIHLAGPDQLYQFYQEMLSNRSDGY